MEVKVILPSKCHFFMCLLLLFFFLLYLEKIWKLRVKKEKEKEKSINLNAKFCHRIIVHIPFILTNWKVRELCLDMATTLGKNTKE